MEAKSERLNFKVLRCVDCVCVRERRDDEGEVLKEVSCFVIHWVCSIRVRFDMGGCFPCFGSSSKEGNGVKKEVVKKDSVKDGSSAQSHHVTRVSSGEPYFLGIFWVFFSFFLFFF